MDRIIDISSDQRHLSRYRGFMVISENHQELGRIALSENHQELGRIALDDIFAVIIHAHGVTYSNSLIAELAQRGALVVICAPNHIPIALILPLDGHHAQAGRIQAQLAVNRPTVKQLWKMIVISKVLMQAAALESWGQSGERLKFLSRKIRSGDPDNIEAQAARIYWPLLMGTDFRRNRTEPGINGLLNYGYTVLRAAVARNIVAAGLHPSIGLHHHNKLNPYALADDLMEPFRPLVDCAVQGLIKRDIDDVTPQAKRILTRLISLDMDIDGTRAPLTSVIQTLCHSLAMSFKQGKAVLHLPRPPSLLELRHLGSSDEPT